MAKIYNFVLLISFIIAFFTQGIEAKNKSDKDEEGKYLIYVKHNFDCHIYNVENSEEYETFINEIVEKIHSLIVENKSTYKNQDVLDKLEKEYLETDYKDISHPIISPYISPTSCVPNTTVLTAYLTPEIAKKVRNIEGVSCEKDKSRMGIGPVKPQLGINKPQLGNNKPQDDNNKPEDDNNKPQNDNTKSNENDECEYLIYVPHNFGQCYIYKENSEEYVTYINELVEKIHSLIVENKSTYKHQDVLEEKENDFHEINDNSGHPVISPYVTAIACTKNNTTLLAYLTPELAKEIESIDGVSGCKKNERRGSIF